MALLATLNEITAKAPAVKNRVDILRDVLTGDDAETLDKALHNAGISSASLTKALRKEYGHDSVKEYSVARWRSANLVELTGL